MDTDKGGGGGGGGGYFPPEKSHKSKRVPSNIGSDPLKITKLPSQLHSMLNVGQ